MNLATQYLKQNNWSRSAAIAAVRADLFPRMAFRIEQAILLSRFSNP